ncbi:MAG: hypothetical protein IJW31_10095 [Lentisphaeria bacterium]|nr:hypothetical protein [Lentisphaeria bacterium]
MNFNRKEIIFGKELSAEDNSVAEYFRTLPSLLDLPGESEVILEKMEERRLRGNVVVSQNVSLPIELQKFSAVFADEEELENDSESNIIQFRELPLNKIPYGFLIKIFRELSFRMIVLYSDNKQKSLENHFLAAICEINKIINRLYDLLIIGFGKKELRNAIAKRLLKDLNKLVEYFFALEKKSANKLNFSNEIAEVNEALSEVVTIILK